MIVKEDVEKLKENVINIHNDKKIEKWLEMNCKKSG